MVLLAPAGIARKGMLIHFRLATIPFLGEMIMQPSAARLKTFWDLAFWDQSFVKGSPPNNQPLQILCEDHVGTYLIPFPCRWRDGE